MVAIPGPPRGRPAMSDLGSKGFPSRGLPFPHDHGFQRGDRQSTGSRGYRRARNSLWSLEAVLASPFAAFRARPMPLIGTWRAVVQTLAHDDARPAPDLSLA